MVKPTQDLTLLSKSNRYRRPQTSCYSWYSPAGISMGSSFITVLLGMWPKWVKYISFNKNINETQEKLMGEELELVSKSQTYPRAFLVYCSIHLHFSC